MRRYNFTPGVYQDLAGFQQWLKQRHYQPGTIAQKANYVGLHISWLRQQDLSPTAITYRDMLGFIEDCKAEIQSSKHMNTVLLAVRQYYDFLKTDHPRLQNPARHLRLKGVIKRKSISLLQFDFLQSLYQAFQQNDHRAKRNRMILGLLLYQGLTTGELQRLEISHINLPRATIHIPGSAKRNGRKLALQATQMLEIQEYLLLIRPEIVKGYTSRLILSMNGGLQLKNSLHHLFRGLKKQYPVIENASQIRSATITHWLKQYNLRQVQYMAGHKYVSSTERYQRNDMDQLSRQVQKHHPIK